MSRTSITTAAIAPVPAAKNRAPTPSPLEADGTPWLVQLREDMVLRDFRPRTQEAYELAARLLVRHFDRVPDQLTEEDLRRYFLHMRDVRKVAPSTLAVNLHGIRFLFLHSLKRDDALFDLLQVKKPRLLPVVLSTTEVRSLLGAVRHPVRRMLLTTIYALGLRHNEGLSLETGHIDGPRHMVWIRDGKGAVDRGVPLPNPLLLRLRRYWKLERPKSNSLRLFVPDSGEGEIDETTIQKTVVAVRKDLGLAKEAHVHTLRHSYATHLLEAGVSLRTIQAILGHKALKTTEVYLHVTQPGTERVQEVLDCLMANL